MRLVGFPSSLALAAIGLILACSEPDRPSECGSVSTDRGGLPLVVTDIALIDASRSADPRRIPLPPATIERLDAAFVELRHEGIVEATAAIVTDDGQVWTSGSERRFWWGSIGKTFTAMLIFALQTEGKLNLSDRANTSIPEVAELRQPGTSSITIDELLAHTAGFPRQLGKPGEDLTKYVAPNQLITGVVIPCPRGERLYSNVGYVLLGLIIEAVEQRPYHEVMNEFLLARLGPTSVAAIGPGPAPEDVVPPIGDPPMSITTPFAAAAIVGSAVDMAIAWKQMLAGDIISRADVASMFAVVYPTPNGLSSRGPDVSFTSTGDVLIWRKGATIGAWACVAWSWRHRAVVAVAFTGEGDPRALVDGLLEALSEI
jgi:D-alanyl-D-alanine carboxypeptidase